MNFDTKFKQDLITKLEEKGLSASSIKLYTRNLEKLNDNLPLKNMNFVKDEAAIIDKLAKYKENTKRGYLISITSALSVDKATKPKEKLYKKYYDLMMTKNKELKTVESTGELSEKQRDNWIKWEDVTEVITELREKVDKFKDSKEINEHNYNTLLSYMTLSLYYYIQPRRNKDYTEMMIIKQDSPDLPSTDNYLVYDTKEFIFNVYKTSKKEGEQREKIPDDLMAVINIYLRFHPLLKGKKLIKGVPFLVYYSGLPLNKINSITRILNKVFKKNIGCSMLRHIFLTGKYGDIAEEQAKDARAMGHSVAMQQDYIKHE